LKPLRTQAGMTLNELAARSGVSRAVDLPAGTRVPYSPWGRNAFTQQLLMLEGAIAVHIDAKAVRLREGDCLDFDVMRAVIFENETRQDARYVIITRRGASYGKM
jgi:transcriptional regulator with XRE-family HTH domain